MSEFQRDRIALSTTTMFDDAIYFSNALNLSVDQNEEDLWNDLIMRAREAGIEDPYRFLYAPATQNISSAISSTSTGDSEHRSSASIRSQETQCTGVTSTSAPSRASRASRDQTDYIESQSMGRMPVKIAQASRSVDSLGTVPVSPNLRQRHSTSSTSQSRSSSPAPQKPSMRRQRTSAWFAMFRKGSSTCTSPSHHGQHRKARGLKLECGHSLSTSALRAHIQEAQRSKGQVLPNCCGKLLPRTILETVLSREEADIALNTPSQSPDIAPSRDSGYSENGMSSIHLPSSLDSPLPAESPISQEDVELGYPTADKTPHPLKSQQQEQLQRISAFENNQRATLQAQHQTSLDQLAARHQALKEEKANQHTLTLEALEDSQITAEHDLRSAQNVEMLNLATALKHMEAYCSNSINTHTSLTHIVTEDDHHNLARQRLVQKNLPKRHESAVNVLRARQERDMRSKVLEQEAEMRELEVIFEKQRLECMERNNSEAERLERLIDERRKRVAQRWALEAEIWRREIWSQPQDGRTSTDTGADGHDA